MAYTKYRTEAIILGGRDIAEASRTLQILSREFGLIRARTQGVRELKSKQKYNLQSFSLGQISLVRGKGGWRVTEGLMTLNFSSTLLEDMEKRRTLYSLSSLIRRMVPGEERDTFLFETFKNGLQAMRKETETESVKAIEALIVIRVMSALGYVPSTEKFQDILANYNYNKDILEKAHQNRNILVGEINRSIQVSGL